jgi:hypothetical protein
MNHIPYSVIYIKFHYSTMNRKDSFSTRPVRYALQEMSKTWVDDDPSP